MSACREEDSTTTMIERRYPVAYLEALCLCEALGRLGFKGEELSLAPRSVPAGSEVIVLVRRAGRSYGISVGEVEGSPELVGERWRELSVAVVFALRTEPEIFRPLYEKSWARQNAEALGQMLLDHGIPIPRLQN